MYKKERIVDLKALTRCVLEKWKGILLVALIAAVLFGGLKGFSLYKVYKQGQAQAEVETVPEEDSQGASKAIEMRRINKQLDLKNAYFTESIMGDIDPTKEGFASADVIVSIDDEMGEAPTQTEEAAQEGAAEGAAEAGSAEMQTGAPQEYAKTQNREMTILNYYGNSAMYRADLTNVAKQLGTTANKLQELISFKYSTNKNSFITVKVIYPDQEGAKLILDEVLTQLQQMVPEAQAQYGPHTMTIANELSATINDTSMYKWAYNRATEIVQLINSKKTLDKNLSSGTDVVVEKTSKRDVVKGAVKQAFAGAVGITLDCRRSRVFPAESSVPSKGWTSLWLPLTLLIIIIPRELCVCRWQTPDLASSTAEARRLRLLVICRRSIWIRSARSSIRRAAARSDIIPCPAQSRRRKRWQRSKTVMRLWSLRERRDPAIRALATSFQPSASLTETQSAPLSLCDRGKHENG